MGNTTSTQPLSSREVTKLMNEFPLSAEGITFYYQHYMKLLSGLDDNADKNDNQKERFNKWLLEKCVDHLFPNLEAGVYPTFAEYLGKLMAWRAQKPKDRLEFYFELLDYNNDGVLSPSDISVFLQELSGYKFQIGDSVRIRNESREGRLAFLGKTQFSVGKWAGIALSKPTGKNNGSVNGVRYFDAKENCGVFVNWNVIELQSHWVQGKEIIELFGAKDTLPKKDFVAKCLSDKWLMSKIMIDPLRSSHSSKA